MQDERYKAWDFRTLGLRMKDARNKTKDLRSKRDLNTFRIKGYKREF